MQQQRSRRRSETGTAPMSLDESGVPFSTESSRRDEDLVARRAFERYEGRGGEHGHDQEDWFEAEREIRGGGTSEPDTRGE